MLETRAWTLLIEAENGFRHLSRSQRGSEVLPLCYLGNEAGPLPPPPAGIGRLRSNPGNLMSRGEHARQQPRQATRPVYLEDAAIVHVMVSTYKAWIEPWENHLQQTGRVVRKAGG